jgi:hypothetical protein
VLAEAEAAATSAVESVTARDSTIVRTPDATTVRPVARPRLSQSEATAQQSDPAPAREASAATQGTAPETTRSGDRQGGTRGNAPRAQD